METALLSNYQEKGGWTEVGTEVGTEAGIREGAGHKGRLLVEAQEARHHQELSSHLELLGTSQVSGRFSVRLNSTRTMWMKASCVKCWRN